MANIDITNNTSRALAIREPVYEKNTLLGANVTYAAGTVLGRITTGGKLTAYTSGASDGSQNPIAVLAEATTLVSGTDQYPSVIIAGRLRRGDLVAHGVGAVSQVECDKLRDYGIIALPTIQLSEQDNQ